MKASLEARISSIKQDSLQHPEVIYYILDRKYCRKPLAHTVPRIVKERIAFQGYNLVTAIQGGRELEHPYQVLRENKW